MQNNENLDILGMKELAYEQLERLHSEASNKEYVDSFYSLCMEIGLKRPMYKKLFAERQSETMDAIGVIGGWSLSDPQGCSQIESSIEVNMIAEDIRDIADSFWADEIKKYFEEIGSYANRISDTISQANRILNMKYQEVKMHYEEIRNSQLLTLPDEVVSIIDQCYDLIGFIKSLVEIEILGIGDEENILFPKINRNEMNCELAAASDYLENLK